MRSSRAPFVIGGRMRLLGVRCTRLGESTSCYEPELICVIEDRSFSGCLIQSPGLRDQRCNGPATNYDRIGEKLQRRSGDESLQFRDSPRSLLVTVLQEVRGYAY